MVTLVVLLCGAGGAAAAQPASRVAPRIIFDFAATPSWTQTFHGPAIAAGEMCSRGRDDGATPQLLRRRRAQVLLDPEGDDAADQSRGQWPVDGEPHRALPGLVGLELLPERLDPARCRTGAPLAEWEAAYSYGDALTYTIAGPGTYGARVYALEGGSGTYTLTVRVNP